VNSTTASTLLRQSPQQLSSQQTGNASHAVMPLVNATTTAFPRQHPDGSNVMANAPGQQAAAPLASNGGMPSNAQQAQNLTQAFGQNAVMNLNALQAHYRGQPQAVVSYMEASIPGFRTLPIQMQLQQMTNVQNAAMQRQRQQSQQQQSQSQLQLQSNVQQQQQQLQQQPSQNQQQPHLRRSSAAQSPINVESPNNRMANRSTQSPMPMATASPGTPQQQLGPRPGTPASANPFLPMSSPAPTSTASPASHHLMGASSGLSYSSPSHNNATSFAMPNAAAQSMAPMMANIPPHLQQQFLQQMQQQQQQQQQMQMQQAPQPQLHQGYSGPSAFSSPQNQANGNQWPQPPTS
jgi:hypothetical protein